jgi:hypothetical protein
VAEPTKKKRYFDSLNWKKEARGQIRPAFQGRHCFLEDRCLQDRAKELDELAALDPSWKKVAEPAKKKWKKEASKKIKNVVGRLALALQWKRYFDYFLRKRYFDYFL